MSAVTMEWQNATNDLSASVERLAEAIATRSFSLVGVRKTAVEESLKKAVEAAGAFSRSGLAAPSALQQQWITTLTKMEATLGEARRLGSGTPSTNGGSTAVDVSGLRIPGTTIIVPYAAILAIAAVGAVAWYVSRKRRS